MDSILMHESAQFAKCDAFKVTSTPMAIILTENGENVDIAEVIMKYAGFQM